MPPALARDTYKTALDYLIHIVTLADGLAQREKCMQYSPDIQESVDWRRRGKGSPMARWE